MNIHQINPYIRHANYSVMKPNHRITTRSILDYELICIQAGQLRLIYDSIEYLCTAGDIVLLHPGVEHSFFVLDDEFSQPHIHFDLVYDEFSENRPISFKSRETMTVNELHMIAEDLLTEIGPSPILPIAQPEEFRAIFFSLLDDYLSSGRQSTFSVRKKMFSLLESILSLCPDYLRSSSDRALDVGFEMIKHYIDTNHHADIDMATLETQFHYSNSLITHRFKERYGVSTIKYYNQKRMETAYEMLKHQSVTHVAEALAFSSIYTFSRAFKNVYGFPPGEVKSRNKVFDENGKKCIR